MARSRALKSALALGVAALLVIGGGGVAFADQVVFDGDGIAPVADGGVSFAACTDKPTQFTILVAARRTSNVNSGNVFANGSSVTVTKVSAPAGMTVPQTSTIAIPGGWDGIAQNTMSNPVAVVVSVAPTASAGTGAITFGFSGVNRDGAAVASPAPISVPVSWTTKACITDSTAPILSLPGTITAEATSPAGAVVTYSATASDAAPANPAVTCSAASPSTFALGTTSVSCSATDTAGNTATGSFDVVVQDTTAPAVGAMSNVVMEATGSTTTVNWTNPTATDAVSGAPAVTCAPASGTAFAVGTTTVTCSATDAAGNAGSSTFTVKISDSTAPSLVLPDEFEVEASGPAGANVVFAASALDAVDGVLAVSCTPASGALFELGATAVDCAVSDSRGNTATGSFIVNVVDTTPPVVTVPADLTVEATGPAGAAVAFTATSDDLVNGPDVAQCVPSSGSTFPLGATDVDCSAFDAEGNEGTASFTVTVVDTTKPQLTLPATRTVEATGPDGAVVAYSATASDIVSGALTPTCTPAANSAFALGSHQVNCEVSDGAGNQATGSFAIYVVDTTGPAITVPDDITAEASGPDGAAVTYEVSASDLVSGAATATCTPASGSTFPLGTTTVACTADDAVGNEGLASFDVVVEDTTAPVVTVPADMIEEATGPDGADVGYAASATDLVDGAVAVTCVPSPGSTFGLGATLVECAATDAARNRGAATFQILVRDTTAPELTVPAHITAQATGPAGAAVDFAATATDLVDGAVTPDCSPGSGSTFALGTHTVKCTAADQRGNASSDSFTVTVEDTTKPIVHVPDTIVREATGPGGAIVGYSVTATDVVDQDVTPACTPEAGAMFPIGTRLVGCTAADDAGNVGEGSFEVIVRDTIAPDLTVPSDQVVEATKPAGADVSFTASATDVVAGEVVPVCTPASGSTFALGTTTVTCVATDGYANKSTRTFTVKVQDTTAPVITWVGGPAAGSTHVFGSVPAAPTCTAADVVSVSVVCQVTGYGATVGPHTMTATATDAAGNASTAQRSYTVAAWRIGGFFQPVDMNGVWNSVKGGSTVPLKFEVFAGATELVGTSAVRSFTVNGVVCPGSSAPVDDIELTTTGGTTLRYDAVAGQFIQNWQTPKKPGACYAVTMTAQDGSSITANFTLK